MPVSLLAAASTGASKTSVAVIDIVIAVAVLVFILYRQVQVRRTSQRMVLPIVLIIIGVASLAGGSSTSSGKLTGSELGILIALLALDAGCLGAVRAWTVRLWRDGQHGVLRQGTWVTVVLWLVGLAIHEGVDFAAHIPAGSTLLYVGVTLLAQQLALQARINRLEQQPWAAQPAQFGGPATGDQAPLAPGPGYPPGSPGPDSPAGSSGPGGS